MFPMMPYSDLYTLNLDWVVKAATQAKKATENIAAFAGVDAVANSADAASVDLDIVDGHYRFTFGLPRGLPGVPGIHGEDGQPGNIFIIGTAIDGHTDGEPFSPPASLVRYFMFNDIYINQNSGNAYQVISGGEGTAAKLRFLFNMKGQTVDHEKIKYETVALNRATATQIAAFARENRGTLGSVTVPPHYAAILVYTATSFFYRVGSPRVGNSQQDNYGLVINDTDNAESYNITAFVYNAQNTSHSEQNVGNANFLLIPMSIFERYAESNGSESSAYTPTVDVEVNENDTGTPQTMPNVVVDPVIDNGLS